MRVISATKLITTVCFLSFGFATAAQTYRPFAVVVEGDSISISYGSSVEEIDQSERVETTVIDRNNERSRIPPAVLDADDLDSLLLQILYEELQLESESFKAATDFSDVQINSLKDKLAIFRQVVLDEQALALDEMCIVWNASFVDLEATIDDTLAAFDLRIDVGKPEVARAVQSMFSSMDLELSPEQRLKFYENLNASRNNLQRQKTFIFSQNARIMGDTEATLKYHCEEVR